MGVEAIIQLGFAIVVATALIRFLMSLVRSYKNTVDNHIESNTKVLVSVASTMSDLSKNVKENTEVLRRLRRDDRD